MSVLDGISILEPDKVHHPVMFLSVTKTRMTKPFARNECGIREKCKASIDIDSESR